MASRPLLSSIRRGERDAVSFAESSWIPAGAGMSGIGSKGN
jgi:hypothetical protein